MKIVIIGRGNVASHLLKALGESHDAICVNPHTLEELRPDSDVFLISVSDDAIREVASRMPEVSGLVAHTSGSTPLSILSDLHKESGVFYPLQTFSKGKSLDYSEIPVFIEGTTPEVSARLRELAGSFSDRVLSADSAARRELHVASVLACNFVNHLWALSSEHLKRSDLDFNLLIPLIKETMHKIESISPADAQTGPARRHDEITIERHLDSLRYDENLRELYKVLSDSIERMYREGN